VAKRKTVALGLMCIIAAAVSAFYILLQQGSVEERTTARIAAFNIQVFGRTKRQKEDVMAVLTKIVREFDIVLVQEIRDSSEQTASYFLQRINEYAYFYNSETVEFIQGSDYVYDDVNDVFEREPYIASFRSGNFDFTLVGIHTKPDDAYSEIGNLTYVVYSILSENPNEKDVIALGDFNADGRYFDEDDFTNLFKASEFYWVITNDVDTMTKTDYTYDRIVLMNATYSYEHIEDGAGVFYFDVEYGISNSTLIEEISDHYPIYAEYATGLDDDD